MMLKLPPAQVLQEVMAVLMHPLYAVGEGIAGRAWRSNSATDKHPKRFMSERMMMLQRPVVTPRAQAEAVPSLAVARVAVVSLVRWAS